MENGDIILNPQYIQYIMQKEQSAQMGGGNDQGSGDEEEVQNGGFGNDDIDSMVDEAVSGMQKAMRLI